MGKKEIIIDTKQIAYCGLYCGACPKHLKGKCPGCHNNEKASWCKVRKCCIEKNIGSCADCNEFENVKDCKLLNNFLAKVFAVLFNSDRHACLDMIKAEGYENFAKFMADNNKVTLKRKKK